MKLKIEMKESIYDCRLQIRDGYGSRSVLLNSMEAPLETEVDLFGGDTELVFLPAVPNIDPALKDVEETTWKDKLVKKAAKTIFSLLDFCLLVGCRYQSSTLQDGDRLTVNLQTYAFGAFDRWWLLELYPMMYMFFEIDKDDQRLLPESAWGINRKKVIRHAKNISLLELFDWGFLFSLLRRPFQVGRVRYLSKNKTVNRKIMKFSRLTEEDRKRFLEKQERFFNS